MTLTSLINKCIQKDSAAEKLLYLRYVDSLMSVAYRYCRDINSAKDVVQNAFVKIYDNLHTFDTQKGNINQWTHRIVVNESLQYIRKQKTWLVGESFIDIESSIEV